MSSNPEQWRYIPTAMNPADCLTRGVKLVGILNLKIMVGRSRIFERR